MSEFHAVERKAEARSRSLFWGTSWMGAYTAVNFLVRLARGFIIPRLLIPATYGLWSSLSVILGYARYSDLGMQQQLGKRLPYELGKKGHIGYWNLSSRGISWTICTSMAISAGLFIYSFAYQGADAWFYQPAFRLLALAIWVQNARSLFGVLLVARQEFRIVGINGALTDVVGLVLCVAGLLIKGVMGLVWALILSELIGAFHCLYHLCQFGMASLNWELRGIVRMIREGLLLLGVTFTEQILMTVDQLFLLRFFSKHEFGIYAVGLFPVGALIGISGIFRTAEPRILELSGSGQKEHSVKIIEASVVLCMIVSALCVAPFMLLIDFLVHFYLKDYNAGLAFYALMPAIALARGPVIVLRSYFLARDRERRLIALQMFGIATVVFLDVLIIWQHWGVPHVILASTMGYLVTSVLMFMDLEQGQPTIRLAKYAVLLTSLVGVFGLFLFYANRGTQPISVQYIIESFIANLIYLLVMICILLATWRSWMVYVRIYIGGTRNPLLLRLKSRFQAIMGYR
ncbi:MAG: hypothetical protein WCC06_03925 [Candidatus Aminicenantales bacterium]